MGSSTETGGKIIKTEIVDYMHIGTLPLAYLCSFADKTGPVISEEVSSPTQGPHLSAHIVPEGKLFSTTYTFFISVIIIARSTRSVVWITLVFSFYLPTRFQSGDSIQETGRVTTHVAKGRAGKQLENMTANG